MLKKMLIFLVSVNAALAGLLVEKHYFESSEHEAFAQHATAQPSAFSAETDSTNRMVQPLMTGALASKSYECKTDIDDAFFALHANDPILRGFVRMQNIKTREFHNRLSSTPPAQLISALLKAIDNKDIDINQNLSHGEGRTPLFLALSSVENISVKNIDLFFERGAMVHNTPGWGRALSNKAPDIIAYMLTMGFDPNMHYELNSSRSRGKINFITLALLSSNFETVDYLQSIGYTVNDQIEIKEVLRDRSTKTSIFTLRELIQQSDVIKNKAKILGYIDNH